ncbi:sensor histidine kinase [Nocardia transvalensis]|uniref:sensor histidine kinase n=1 Tax=Nocardia transvalensis TaxID=37333 RepID=UPI0018962E31|nr:HAMP domain-containing sensor histidine kinase [Nocardia transvalensis]MBF6328402.1 HAMP domain-containing histidine kinase [Nocardia transvalensis]
MRRRLLAVLTVFATLAVLSFAAPLCSIAATSRTQQLVLGRTADADWFATIAATAATTGDAHALAVEVGRYHELYGDDVLIVDARGTPLAGAGADPQDPVVQQALADARRNQRAAPVTQLLPWGPDTVLIARPIGTGVQVNGAVVIEAATARARTDILRTWGIVAAGALAAMALFTVLALALSRWVLRPLAQLSGAVAELTATLPKPRDETIEHATMTRRYGGPPEIRAVAESFDAMALAVLDSAAAQRQLVADTAHAMRNPLAALTIRLDSLQPAIPPPAAATFRGAVAEVERLTGLLDGLLSLAVAEATSDFDPADAESDTGCDAVRVAEDRVDAWHTAFEHAGLTLELATAAERLDVAVPAAVLAQILDVALSNSCRYAGDGAHTRLHLDRTPDRVTLTVSDNGVGVPDTEIDKLTTRFFRGSTAATTGSGLGLPIAAALTTARQGTLTVQPVHPHGLAVVIELPAGVPQ